MNLPFTKHRNAGDKYAFALWFLFLTGLAGTAAYYQMFSGFSSYDDEGTVLVTIKEYLGGIKLYNQISIPYGPVYFFYNWAVRTFSRTPVTHDMIRMSSLIPWLLTALASAWIVFRLTDSIVLASLTHLVISVLLSTFFPREPGHPQELCIFLLVCLVASGVATMIPRCRSGGVALIGILTAALLFVKVNIGIFVFVAGSLAILANSPKTKLSRLAFNSIAAASLLLPILLMKSHLQDEPTKIYAGLVITSTIAVLLVLYRLPGIPCFQFRDCWIASSSFAVTFVGVILALKAGGVGLNAMLHALVLDSLTTYVTQGYWYTALPADPRWILWIAGGLAAALYFSRRTPQKNQAGNETFYLKLALCVFTMIALCVGTRPFWLVLPFCWLVLVKRHDINGVQDNFPRTLLCTATVLQALYAYPIAGSQLSLIQVLPIIVVMTWCGDLLAEQQNHLPVAPGWLRRAAKATLLLSVVAAYLVIARAEHRFYYILRPLQLAGAARVHVYPVQVRQYGWLVQNLNDHCDIFVGLPESPSLHIWTGNDAVVGLELDNWIFSASDKEQNTVSAILSQHPGACAIYNPDLVEFWSRKRFDLNSLPLVQYLHENFKVVGGIGPFYLLARNERNLDIVSPSPINHPFDPAKINEAWKSNGCIGKDCSR